MTPSDIADAYTWGWEMGLKALAIYRDGIEAKPAAEHRNRRKEEAKEGIRPYPRRRRLPDTRQSMTHKFNVGRA